VPVCFLSKNQKAVFKQKTIAFFMPLLSLKRGNKKGCIFLETAFKNGRVLIRKTIAGQ
jgi:hypothetical protein